MSNPIENLTDEQVERVGRRVAEMVKEARENPVFMDQAMEKLALNVPQGLVENPMLHSILKLIASGGVIGAGVTGGAKAVDMISDKIQERRNSVDKAKQYQAMMTANPDLGQGADAQMVQRHFNTLHKFNPEYASDPMVSGAYVHNSLAYARPNIDQLNNVVKARSSIMQARKGDPMKPGQRAADIMGKATAKLIGIGDSGGGGQGR